MRCQPASKGPLGDLLPTVKTRPSDKILTCEDHPELAEPIKGRFVADFGHRATGICDDIHVVAEAHGIAGGPEQANVGGEAREDQVGAARGLQGGDQLRLIEAAQDATALEACSEGVRKPTDSTACS
jgi:hypothetical protein